MAWTITKKRQKMIDFLARHDRPVNASDIADETGDTNARYTLHELQHMRLVFSTWDTPEPGVHWGLTEAGRDVAKI